MTIKPLTSVTGFETERKNLVMQITTLIKMSYIPKDNDPSPPPTAVGEKNEIALLGFISLGLNG